MNKRAYLKWLLVALLSVFGTTPSANAAGTLAVNETETLTANTAETLTANAAEEDAEMSAPHHQKKTVVFIHGMFNTPNCWDDWKLYFEAKGYTVLAPPWPLHDKPVDALRKAHPDPALGRLTLEEVVDAYTQVIGQLSEKPILVGHSMGGLIVQLLLQKQLGAAGVAVDSAPPKGVVTLKWSFLKSNWPVVSPFADKNEPYLMDLEAFRYTFAHTLPPDALQAAYDRLVVPESRRVGRGPTTDAAYIDFAAPRPPLLLIAGAEDHIIPASLNRKNFEKYRASAGITDLKVFPDRTHYILGQERWQEVADYILEWIDQHGP